MRQIFSLTFAIFFASFAVGIASPISQKLWHGFTASDLEALKKISLAIRDKNYDEALSYANQIQSQSSGKTSVRNAVTDIILWNKFSSIANPKTISFSDISRFAIDNPFYPNISEIRRNVERVAIENDVPYIQSEYYFSHNPVQMAETKLRVVEGKIENLSHTQIAENEKELQRRQIQNSIATIWVKENFSAEEEKIFFAKYFGQLSEINHANRIDRLLWDGRNDDAKRIMNLVNEDYQSLFNAIIELQNSPHYIDKIIATVPRRLRSSENLTYRRVIWHKAKDQLDELLDLMLDVEAKFPEKWFSLRRLYTREMLKQKEYKTAYKLISRHNLSKNSSDYWEAEWTSGWIALRFLDQPKISYKHFENLYQNVSQPVTLARGAYWLAMASEAMNNKWKAIEWYREAAKYPVFFYGQLAIHKHRLLDPVGAQDDIILPKDPDITGRDMAKIAESRAAQVAYLLAITGDKTNAAKIFEWLINNSEAEGQIAVVMKIVNELGDRELDARLSRTAARKNVFFIKDKFQIVREVTNDENAPLVHAIIKQESGFVPSAMSGAGAIGFMQLMPNTAKLIAKELKISYDRKKLATDIKYNIRLGSYYITKLTNRFEGSEMLAIASYNAGPNATQRWINEFYDPRKEKDIDKVIDWIELITYSETRNYVQRIMENLIVYKYLMSRANYDAVQ
ncbi:MAG: hypothetical protein A3H30_07050 [Alphaproteobacteria bacterium RIFCSPLOWO2_02_FULL_40_19]|nr:MAG: hypothetical protein A3H30_07050 [Alphaproteobacteria bacterium RIFCSPLOWO2_02_FULL_40_19]